jgi:hypothetical protein
MQKALVAFSVAFGLTLTACGGLLGQAVDVQKAVEAKNHEVDKVSVNKNGEEKVVTVYTPGDVAGDAKQEIVDTAQATVPDATKVRVKTTPTEVTSTPRKVK